MELLLNRNPSVGDATISPLLVDCVYECDILEDVIREVPGLSVFEWKIHGMTAIPAGRYEVIITMSPHFRKMLPRLLKVPGYAGVLIHGGNKATDTDGCLITGKKGSPTTIAGGTSQPALKILQKKIQDVLNRGERVWITINNPPQG